MLYWEPVSYLSPGERRTPQTRVWERNRDQEPDSPFRVRAFRWGNLTSGSKWSAFWILLAPFAFSNVAGWMADGRRTTQALLRLSALGMTALFTAQLAVVGVDFVYQLAFAKVAPEWMARLAPLVLGVGAVIALWRLSTRSQLAPFSLGQQTRLMFGVNRDAVLTSPDQAIDDPAPGARLGDESMWVQQPVLHLLRRLHLAFALAVIALMVSWGTQAVGPTAAAVLVLVAVAASVTGPGTELGVLVAQGCIWVSGIVLVWAAFSSDLATTVVGAGRPRTHDVVFLSVGLVLVSVLAAVISHQRRFRMDSWIPAGAVTVGTLLGGAFGVGVAVMAEFGIYRWAPAVEGFQSGGPFAIANAQVMVNGGSWVAVAMMAFLLWLLSVAAISALVARGADSGLPPKEEGESLTMLRRVTLRARWVLGLTGLVGLALAGLAGAVACSGEPFCSPTRLAVDLDNTVLAWVVASLFGLALVVIALAVSRLNTVAALVAALLLAGVGWLVWAENPPFGRFEVPVIGLPVDLSRLVDLSFLVMVLGIAFFIVNSVVGGFRDPERRRKVGILWDVASFWPRWFHPLAPPAYGPEAVQSLRRQIPPDSAPLLAAHSQGSVIAVAALDGAENLPNGLVTYGSPLGILYARLFPSVGVGELCGRVGARMGARWVNLWRGTDPLGGLPVPGVADNRRVDTDTGHSRYELTIDFDQARRDVAG